jgi:hypothetical protein
LDRMKKMTGKCSPKCWVIFKKYVKHITIQTSSWHLRKHWKLLYVISLKGLPTVIL